MLQLPDLILIHRPDNDHSVLTRDDQVAGSWLNGQIVDLAGVFERRVKLSASRDIPDSYFTAAGNRQQSVIAVKKGHGCNCASVSDGRRFDQFDTSGFIVNQPLDSYDAGSFGDGEAHDLLLASIFSRADGDGLRRGAGVGRPQRQYIAVDRHHGGAVFADQRPMISVRAERGQTDAITARLIEQPPPAGVPDPYVLIDGRQKRSVVAEGHGHWRDRIGARGQDFVLLLFHMTPVDEQQKFKLLPIGSQH